MKIVPMMGKKFGRLSVMEFSHIEEKRREKWWKCLCECGNAVTLPGNRIRSRPNVGCGCLEHSRKPVMDRIWPKVEKKGSEDCWLWVGKTQTKFGYGMVSIPTGKSGSKRSLVTSVHRVIYENEIGPILKGQVVRHSCDNPACCNPKHLCVGTQKDNIRDAISRGRNTFGEKHPMAKLTNEEICAIRLSNRPYYEIAKRFGVSPSTISLIKSGKRRRDIAL